MFFASPEELEGGCRPRRSVVSSTFWRTVDLQQEAADLERHGIRVLTWNDEGVPNAPQTIGTPHRFCFTAARCRSPHKSS